MNKETERCCRICGQWFCCANCKDKHAIKEHKIAENCDICIYGQIGSKRISEKLIEHVKTHHLPLRCLYCKILFTAIEDLRIQHMCIKSDEKDSTKNYESPPTSLFQKNTPYSSMKFFSNINNVNYLTSTPIQTYGNVEIHKMPGTITPVGYGTGISEKSLINSNKCNFTAIPWEQSSSIKGHFKDKKQTVASITTPKITSQHSLTTWKTALTEEFRANPKHIFTDVVSPSLSAIENSSVTDELYKTTEDCTSSAATNNVNHDGLSNVSADQECKSPFLLENIAEESFVYNDNNQDPDMDSPNTQEKATSISVHSSDQASGSMWFTMSTAWKKAWKGLLQNYKGEELTKSKRKIKRSHDDDLEGQPVKRIRIANISCRENIHEVPILRYVTDTKLNIKKTVVFYDKATQT
ncbi:hypothetical protein FQR65_LT14112 [Abscondita terminalis]|nr:hypothetical protein FQR65_LT14112 [Abscondita terminalis]